MDLIEIFYETLEYIIPYDLVKYDLIFLVGESAAGKTTTMNILKGKGFNEKYTPNPKGKIHNAPPIFNKGVKFIKVIDTAGGYLKDLPKWKEKNYTIRCIIFDTTKFYKDKKVRLGIKNTVKEVDAINGEYIDKKFKLLHKIKASKKEKTVKCVAIGTRGNEIDNEVKEKIRNEVHKLGIHCKIFELSNNPKKELIKFIFQGE